MSKEDHVEQDIERIGQRHQDREWRSPREEHQPASDRLEKANPKDQIARFLKREHELTNVAWRIADRVTIDGKANGHDPRAEKE